MATATTGGLFGSGSTGFSFGSGTTTTGFGTATLGASTSGSTTLGGSGFSAIKPFGVSTTTATLSTPFGQPAATAAGATSAFKLGGQSLTTGTSFSGFNTTKAAATAPTLALLGSTATAATGLGLGTSFGGFNAIKTTAASSTTTSTTLSGLGGTGTSTGGGVTGAVGGVAGRQGDVKDTPLPNPLNEIAEHIKKYVKEQKEHRDEISRVSGSALDKVREETVALRQALALVSNSIQRDGCAVENLKIDVSQELKNAEIAQRTNDIPPALQHENVAPRDYFQRLVESFEERMLMYRKQIEIMESHLASLSQGQTLTPQDLSDVMHKVHETFIALAAQLHEFHEAVKVQKEHYLNYRRAYFKDSTDIFSSSSKDLSKTSAEFTLGPSPFRVLSNNSASAVAATTNVAAPQVFGLTSLQTNTTGLTGTLGATGTALSNPFGTATGLGGTNLAAAAAFGSSLNTGTLGTTGLGAATGFGTPSGFGTPALGASTGGAFGSTATGLAGSAFGAGTSAFSPQPKFQLQRPPAGNKRGKRR
ncbi:Nucleoporin p58/p45 [Desmophyllum pertusum]|uniref:Nucleoporin p58/p45 n=1 Tax=Desmophyllum pertusum TaxID=174260 RepID=A0A9X0D7T1_9CNID|nr:Nucleoporin p58/p45 [Desmophyllum pertusum]